MNRTQMVTGSKQEFLLSDTNFTAELADYCHLSLLVDRDCVQWAVTTIDKDMVVEVGELISPSEKQLEGEKHSTITTNLFPSYSEERQQPLFLAAFLMLQKQNNC